MAKSPGLLRIRALATVLPRLFTWQSTQQVGAPQQKQAPPIFSDIDTDNRAKSFYIRVSSDFVNKMTAVRYGIDNLNKMAGADSIR
jgi:hypothetical protein